MDPLTTIIGALVAGATAASKDIAVQAIKDSYAELKALVVHKFGQHEDIAVALEKVEQHPNSEGRQITLKEELALVQADRDQEVLSAARRLLELLKMQGQLPGVANSATLTGSGAIAQGQGAVAAGQGGVAAGGNITGSTIVTGSNNVVDDRNTVARDPQEPAAN